MGVKVSESEDGPHRFYINNHARFTILYHRDADTDLARIVGFEVEPASVRHEYDRWDDSAPRLKTCAGNADEPHPLGESPQIVAAGEEIVFTYDVVFKSSPVRWASRWDTYLQTQDREIHWFSVVNSAMILLFLSGMVAMIMIRTLRRDITQYNQLETVEETAEETGWKLVSRRRVQAASAPGALSVCIGTGSQLLGMTFVTMIFAVLGFLSPANRGGLMTAMLMLFVFMGAINGCRHRANAPGLCADGLAGTHVEDRFGVPVRRLRRGVRAQPARLGSTQRGCGSLWHAGRASPALGRHPHPARLRGILLWIQDDAAGDSRQDE